MWDASLQLCKYFETNGFRLSNFKNKTILDMGSGTGISGLVIALLLESSGIPANVILSDKQEMLPLLSSNIPANLKHVKISTECIDWTNPECEIKAHLILLSDCVVWPSLFDGLIKTLEMVTDKSSVVFISYEKRKFDVEAEFFVKLSASFRFSLVKEQELDPVYRADDLFIFECSRKDL